MARKVALVQNGVHLSKIQRQMLEILSDGKPHNRKELFACLYEQDAPIYNIITHISKIRKYLRRQGQDVINTIHRRRRCYIQVRLLHATRERY